MTAVAIRAEALWGDELKKLLVEIRKLENELAAAIRDFITTINPDESEYRQHLSHEERAEQRKTIYGTIEDNDPFMKTFGAAVEKKEKYLRPKLVHY